MRLSRPCTFRLKIRSRVNRGTENCKRKLSSSSRSLIKHPSRPDPEESHQMRGRSQTCLTWSQPLILVLTCLSWVCGSITLKPSWSVSKTKLLLVKLNWETFKMRYYRRLVWNNWAFSLKKSASESAKTLGRKLTGTSWMMLLSWKVTEIRKQNKWKVQSKAFSKSWTSPRLPSSNWKRISTNSNRESQS